MKIALSVMALVVVLLVASVGYVWRHPMAIFNAMNRRALKKAAFVRSEIKTPAGSQIVWEAGSGPDLFLLHGAGDQAGTWSKVAPQFTNQYRVHVLDIAGHGESEPRTGAITMETMLNTLDAVIEQTSGTEPATIVGNSMGAWLAMLYAQSHPERVYRLVLVDGGAITGERPDLALLPNDRAEMRRFFDNIMDPNSPRPPDFVLDDIVRESRTGAMGRLVAAADQWPEYLMDGKLAQFATPVDLVWGESDRLMPLHYAQRLQAELPASRLTTIPGCGHVPQQECPRTFTEKLKEVLTQPVPTPVATKAQAAVEKQ